MHAEPESHHASPEKRLHKVRNQALELVSSYRRAVDRGGPTRRLKLELAHAILDYADELHQERNQTAAKALWDELDLSPIHESVGETVSIPRTCAGRSEAVEYDQQPALYTLDESVLYEALSLLEDIHNRCGFGRDVDRQRPTGVVGSAE